MSIFLPCLLLILSAILVTLGQEDLKESRAARSDFATIILMKIELYGASSFSK